MRYTPSLLCLLVLVPVFLSCSDNSNEVGKAINNNLENISNRLSEENPRFEILQSHISAYVTLKFDTYTGDCWILTSAKSGGNYWDVIEREDSVLDVNKNKNKRNYKIFLSGLAVRYTYMINVNTGTVWQLCEDKKTDTVMFEVM